MSRPSSARSRDLMVRPIQAEIGARGSRPGTARRSKRAMVWASARMAKTRHWAAARRSMVFNWLIVRPPLCRTRKGARSAFAVSERGVATQLANESFRTSHVRFGNFVSAVAQVPMRSDFPAPEAFLYDHGLATARGPRTGSLCGGEFLLGACLLDAALPRAMGSGAGLNPPVARAVQSGNGFRLQSPLCATHLGRFLGFLAPTVFLWILLTEARLPRPD